jgi:ABC-2 type transport system ATP-binding protein
MSAPLPEPLRISPALHLDAVSSHIGKRVVLDSITMDVPVAAIEGVLGPNGAGKSTLLSLVTGLRRASSGSVTVLGEKLPVRGGGLRRRIGVVLQETALYDELTAIENLRFSAALYGVHHADARIAQVLELLGLSERAGDPVHTLSGGLRRRIAIARALVHEPELLVIDEPTLGVDAEARHAIWSHLRLLRSLGTTILVATNYLDEAQALCDTVAVLRGGRLVVHEKPDVLVLRAGRCIDVECETSASDAISRALAGFEGVLRVDETSSGVSIFLDGNAVPDAIIRAVLNTTSMGGFRTRAADLAEVFRALNRVS